MVGRRRTTLRERITDKTWACGMKIGKTVIARWSDTECFPVMMLHTECSSPAPETFTCWILTAVVMVLGSEDFKKRRGHEGGGIMNGISGLIKEAPQSLLPCEDTKELGTRMRALASTLTLDFPASSTVTYQCLLLKPPSLWNFC